MKSCLLLIVLSGCIASTLAVKCFVCSSLQPDKNSADGYLSEGAYHVRACQGPKEENCTGAEVYRTLSIREYYQGAACATFNADKLNKSDSNNVVDCKVGCAKIYSTVTDRGSDVSRTTRQCAFYDKDVVGKYIDTPGFKRTGAGSDKVANWFYYCSTDYCNTASGLSHFSAIMIASFYGVVAFLYH